MRIKLIIAFLLFALLATAQVVEEAPVAPVEQTEDMEQSEVEEVVQEATDDGSASAASLPSAPPKDYRVSDQHWDKAESRFDYSDEKEKKKKEADTEVAKSKDLDPGLKKDLSNMLQILAIVLLLALVAGGVFLYFRDPRDKKIQGNYDIEIDRIEERLHETDLMRYLREALAQKDYAVAVRLYFLQMLKDLSNSGHIKWSKEKTNRSYLNELYTHRLHAQMAENTRMYETVWFGNTRLTEASFRRIEPAFRDLLHQTGKSLTP